MNEIVRWKQGDVPAVAPKRARHHSPVEEEREEEIDYDLDGFSPAEEYRGSNPALNWEDWVEQARHLPQGERRRHASVSRDNRHRCHGCFCCACLMVEQELSRGVKRNEHE